MPNFSFDTNMFRATSLFISSEETRYYLQGVHVQPVPDDAGGGVIMTATDGHRIASIYDENGSADRKIILSCRWKDPALKTGKRETGRRAFLTGNLADGYVATIRDCPGEIETGDYPPQLSVMAFKEIDGTFPEWERVFPDDMPFEIDFPDAYAPTDKVPVSVPLAFNHNYLKSFGDAARILTESKCMEMILSSYLHKPLQIRFSEAPHAAFGLMRMRGGIDTPFPEWLIKAKNRQRQLETDTP